MKTCPQCSALVFDDLDTCYECMFRFDGNAGQTAPAPRPLEEAGAGEGPVPDGKYIALGTPPLVNEQAILHMTVYGTGGYGVRVNSVLHLIPGQTLVIGQSESCDVILHGPNVAREHARLSLVGGGTLELEDLGSASGTMVNGVPISGRCQLQPGNEVGIGSARITVNRQKNKPMCDLVDMGSLKRAR